MLDHRTAAQQRILSNTLGNDSDHLYELQHLGSEFLYELNAVISAYLFDLQQPVFRRVSLLAPLLPNSLVSKLAPKLVDPIVAGRVAGALAVEHTERIEDLLSRLPAEYVADCVPHLDPRSLAHITSTLSVASIAPAARVLLQRHEYVTAAAFLEFADPALICELRRAVDDDPGLVQVAAASFRDNIARTIVAAISEDRFSDVVTADPADPSLLIAGCSVIARLQSEVVARLVRMIGSKLSAVGQTTLTQALSSERADPLSDVICQVLDTMRA